MPTTTRLNYHQIPNATTQSGGGPFTAVPGDMIWADSSGAGVTVTIPLASANIHNLPITVKKISSDLNVVTLVRSGADLIDGQTSQAIPAPGSPGSGQWNAITIVPGGSNLWYII